MISPTLDRISIDEWHDFVASHPRATAFHHRDWLNLLIEQYGYPAHVFAIRRDSAVVSAVPFLETRSLTGKRKLISLPFTDWMEILTGEDDGREEIVRALVESRFPRYDTVVIRTDTPLKGAPVTNGWVRHELYAGDTFEDFQARLSPAAKRNLKKAERNDLTFERRTDADAMEIFYRLHLLTRRKLGVPIQAKSFFRQFVTSILDTGLGFVGVVRRGQDPIAAGVFLTRGQMMTYKYGASHPKSLQWRPNDCMVYNAIRLASREGHTRFDFGISRLQDEGLRRFKTKWGGREKAVHFEYVVGEASAPSARSLPLGVASFAIRHGPALCCLGLGKMFYKYSP